MSSLSCDIVTPEAKLLSEDFYMVIVPGVEGEMGFLQGHAPLVSALADGTVRLHKEAGDKERAIALQGGYVEVTGEKVIILANRACAVEDIDVEAVRAEREEALHHLEQLSDARSSSRLVRSAPEGCRVSVKDGTPSGGFGRSIAAHHLPINRKGPPSGGPFCAYAAFRNPRIPTLCSLSSAVPAAKMVG